MKFSCFITSFLICVQVINQNSADQVNSNLHLTPNENLHTNSQDQNPIWNSQILQWNSPNQFSSWNLQHQNSKWNSHNQVSQWNSPKQFSLWSLQNKIPHKNSPDESSNKNSPDEDSDSNSPNHLVLPSVEIQGSPTTDEMDQLKNFFTQTIDVVKHLSYLRGSIMSTIISFLTKTSVPIWSKILLLLQQKIGFEEGIIQIKSSLIKFLFQLLIILSVDISRLTNYIT